MHHISAKGWTPAFSLFGLESCNQDPCENFLELLSAASFDDFNAQDREGWTIMHRAAHLGTGNQIRSLISRNVSLDIQTNVLRWTPIFCSVLGNNLSTFAELIQYEPRLLEATDVRNWTLLHVAVNSGSLDIMRLLIQLGADPHALSYPTKSFIPKDLRSLSLTPGDIAKMRGLSIFTAYVNALAAIGHEVCVAHNREDNTLDIFWPALEHFSEERSP